MVAGYVSSEEVRNNKRKLYEYVKSSGIGVAWELPELNFYQEVPICSYEEYRKKIAIEVEQKNKKEWEHLYKWSKGFHKFVCYPLSEKFLRTRSKKELKLFFRSIDYHILEKAFILYSHEARIRILHCYSDRIKRKLLKKVKRYSKAGTLSLTECVEAESMIHKAIEKFWQLEIGGCLEEYMQERKSIIDKLREASGEKYFIIPHNLSVKRCEDGIILTIKPVNVDYTGMTHVYDIDWKYPITKYAFIFYRYVLDGKGKVFIDIEGKNELPVYDFQNNCKQGDYFLFLYRLMKLERCYSWIVLSDIIKNVVCTFEQNLLSMKGIRDSFIRLPVRPLNYHEKILKGISDSGRIMDEIFGKCSRESSNYVEEYVMVNIKIHRGTSQIGGTITEIYTENTHIFIDFGSELTVNPEDSTDGKMIAMIKNAECDAVLFSHYHGDHVGLLEHIPAKDIRGKEITLGIGKVARQVLANIQRTLANDISRPEEQQAHKEMLSLLQDNGRWLDFVDALTEGNEKSSTFDVGDFHITTIRVDHSAYDSYMFVIEAEGKCIVHTGDFRVHGRLGEGFFDRLKNFMENKKVDVLLIEGTMLGRLDENVLKEEELLKEATELLKKPENKYAYLICSSTNMESLASFHKAVLFSNKAKEKAGDKDCKRAMYVNHYVKQQMDLFASAEPDITWGFRKANPFEQHGKYNENLGMSQMEYMEENGVLILLGKSDSYKKYIEPFRDKNPLLIYSMWKGYVSDKNKETNDPKMKALYESFPEERRVDLHTSGHAVKDDLEEMIAIVNPRQAIVPIHTEFKESYEELDGVGELLKCLKDGQVLSLEQM